MIVTRTPLRITLGGGGTDLPSYYRDHGGFVFAMGIDQYVHVMLNRPPLDRGVRVRHGRSEMVTTVAELEHDLARVALSHHGIEDRIDLSSMADLPEGTGLGSSGSYLVGLLAALHESRGSRVTRQELAEEACMLELDVLGRRVGKQDQYMAAYGGLTVLDIDRDGRVAVRSVELDGDAVGALVERTHLYYTGVQRSAASVLQDQDRAMSAGAEAGAAGQRVADSLHGIRELGHRILETIEDEDFDGWGRLLHEHWVHKKRLSNRVSLAAVDALYDHVRSEYGVLGGKIAGAGGGGFLLLYCERDDGRLEAFMESRGMPRLRYGVASGGSRVMAGPSDGREAAAPAPGLA
jgi:D-glycero-alpha-D-manno-heptose-7-phosphate kinase